MLPPSRNYSVQTSSTILTHMYLKLLPSAPVSKYLLTYITTEEEDLLVSDILELLQNLRMVHFSKPSFFTLKKDVPYSDISESDFGLFLL